MHEILVLGDGSAPYLPPMKDVGEKDHGNAESLFGQA